jgi:hypothetical protein
MKTNGVSIGSMHGLSISMFHSMSCVIINRKAVCVYLHGKLKFIVPSFYKPCFLPPFQNHCLFSS